jgi:hypothetical protein
MAVSPTPKIMMLLLSPKSAELLNCEECMTRGIFSIPVIDGIYGSTIGNSRLVFHVLEY